MSGCVLQNSFVEGLAPPASLEPKESTTETFSNEQEDQILLEVGTWECGGVCLTCMHVGYMCTAVWLYCAAEAEGSGKESTGAG